MKYAEHERNFTTQNWLGELPDSWVTKRLKYVSTINDETLPETTDPDYELLYVDIGSVDATEGILKKEPMIFETAPSRARRIVQDGDTIVSTVRTYLRAVAPIQNPEENLIVSTGFAVIRPKGIDPHYLAYSLRSSYFIETVVSRSVGVSYPATNPTDVSCIKLPLPPIDEQQAIARLLDAKTAQIDALVAQKRQLIAKLKEKRSALIARTVTRGLPPEAAKAAGLEPNPEMGKTKQLWIGEVPTHWSVKPLKYVSEIKTGFAFSSDDFTDEGIPVLRIGDLSRDGDVDLSDAKYLPMEYLGSHAAVNVRNGDILMAMTGATIGKAARYKSNSPALLNQRVCAFRAVSAFHQGYLWFILNSDFYIRYVLLIAFGGAQPNISDKQLLDCFVPIPPPQEQVEISKFLEIETSKLDNLMSQANSAIDRLTEYRQALITSAVTGKIDVRGVA